MYIYNLFREWYGYAIFNISFCQIDELEGQKRLRTEMIQAEDNLAQMRKEYEMLRIEFEQAMAANDQNGLLNKHFFNWLKMS